MNEIERLQTIIKNQRHIIEYEREINKAQSENVECLIEDVLAVAESLEQPIHRVVEDKDQLLFDTQDSLAKALGVAQITVWKWLQAGKVPKKRGLKIKVIGDSRRNKKYQIIPDRALKNVVASNVQARPF